LFSEQLRLFLNLSRQLVVSFLLLLFEFLNLLHRQLLLALQLIDLSSALAHIFGQLGSFCLGFVSLTFFSRLLHYKRKGLVFQIAAHGVKFRIESLSSSFSLFFTLDLLFECLLLLDSRLVSLSGCVNSCLLFLDFQTSFFAKLGLFLFALLHVLVVERLVLLLLLLHQLVECPHLFFLLGCQVGYVLLVLLELCLSLLCDVVDLFLQLTLLVYGIVLDLFCPLLVIFSDLLFVRKLRVDIVPFGLQTCQVLLPLSELRVDSI